MEKNMSDKLKPYVRLAVSVIKARPMGVVHYDKLMHTPNPATVDVPGYLIVDDLGNKGWMDKQTFDMQFSLVETDGNSPYTVDISNHIREALYRYDPDPKKKLHTLINEHLSKGTIDIIQLVEALECEDDDILGYVTGKTPLSDKQKASVERLMQKVLSVPQSAHNTKEELYTSETTDLDSFLDKYRNK